MSQEYELISFKVSDFKDDYGNTWCDAVFKGVGEPVKWVVKDPFKVTEGVKYFGRLEVKTSKAGKPYQRFYAEKKEDSVGTPENTTKEESIHRSVALQQAVLFCSGEVTTDYLLGVAEEMYGWLTKQPTPVKPIDPKLQAELDGEDKSDEIRQEIDDQIAMGEEVPVEDIPF